ncbi:hypothetical protein P3X46_000233 [Hevea brasiliensis]|uniref:FAS1 domain-containing protein n=1 Tax=Hevea brasiliensis TaxID=3981 RepID=A0ABQ9NB13_HEVBR|nr:fasciclin-like arabinogalactan protein 12 [Hevea brasiliensis]KAJ9188877.1 hypothetical protein P3X46_000233 [Hevea brasiliensis]
MQQSIFSLTLLLLFFHCTNTLSQSPASAPVAAPAQAPSHHPSHRPHSSSPPPGPTDVIQILLKAGHFITFIRLIKATHVDFQLTSQLNSSTDGITVFAPTDTAFTNLKAGALDSLNDKEKLAFVQFHILPRFLSISDFQTLSNPVKTLAGSDDRYPVNISTTDSSVSISTGLTKTSIANTVYTDKQVAIYEIDKVLLPKLLFPPATAPAPAKSAETPEINPKDASSAMSSVLHYNGALVLGVVLAAAMLFL